MRAGLATLFLALLAGTDAADADSLQLSSGPTRIYIEALADRQDVNFELFLRNDGPVALSLRRVQLSVPTRGVPAGASLTVFNPFPSFARDLPIATLQYELTLSAEADDAPDLVRSSEVHALSPPGLTALDLPLRGPIINYDGHDAGQPPVR